MDQCRLPVEVCERIIDFVGYGRSDRFHFPSHLNDLRACALTCRNWLPRSRLNLYRCVWFQERCQLERVSQNIADHPFLAEFVQELFLGRPLKENPEQGHHTGALEIRAPASRFQRDLKLTSAKKPMKDHYILPFAEDALVRALRNVRILTLSHFPWHALHHRYHETAAQYRIVELNIIGACFKTLPDLLRVVWAFRHLRTLRLIDIKFEGTPSINLENIVQKRPRVCLELTDLHVVGVSRFNSCRERPIVHRRGTSQYRLFSSPGRAPFRADVSGRI